VNQQPEEKLDSEEHPFEKNDQKAEADKEIEEAQQDSEDQNEEDLPEYEPLTPELVEDEAIRGDFVIRWALVLLAFLVSFTEISDSQTLVQIRSGQYIASHGFLPPANDVFSYSVKDQPWLNLSWLHDLLLGGIYSVSGMNGITILKAAIIALTFYLITRISIFGVSTWWGTICGSLALIVCYPQLTAQPEIVTLLGVSLTLFSLFRWQETESKRYLYLLLPAYLIWANSDPRFFLGPVILIFFTIGHVIDLFSGRLERFCFTDLLQVGFVAVASLVVAVIHPFGWNTLLSPVDLYSKVYPAIHESLGADAGLYQLQFSSILKQQYYSPLNPHSAAGFILIIAAVISFYLNRRKLQFSYLLVFLSLFIFAGAGSHEFVALSIASAVFATLNAQQWYRDNFRQTYSTDIGELIFSRGGRALTVLALFTFAYMGIGGSFAGSLNRRIGMGIHPVLQNYIESFKPVVENTFDDRPFNFRPSQGDILIWHGQKVFIDSRMELYSRLDNQFLKNYQGLRFSLLKKNKKISFNEDIPDHPQLGDSKIWKKTFDELQVTHVLPRLQGNKPDYTTFRDLIFNKEWTLLKLTPSTALFYRNDLKENENLNQYLKENQLSFTSQVFRTEEVPQDSVRIDWAKKNTSYGNYLSRPELHESNEKAEAKHYSFLLNFPFQDSSKAAIAFQVIRKANESLYNNPKDTDAYRILGGAYLSLAQVESSVARKGNAVYEVRRRYLQASQALNQSLVLDPDQPAVLLGLGQYYLQNLKYDLALKSFNQAMNLMGNSTSNEKELQQLAIRSQKLDEFVNTTIQEIKKSLGEKLNPVIEAQFAYQKGCVLHSRNLILNEQEMFNQTPELKVFQAHVLMETGDLEQAFQLSSELEQIADQFGMKNWATQAAYANLGLADYQKSSSIWIKEAEKLEHEQVFKLIQNTPFVSFNTESTSTKQWPLNQIISSAEALYTASESASSHRFNAALSLLEAGNNKDAEKNLRQILNHTPETPLRPLIRFYLFQLTGEAIDMLPPSERIPINPGMFHSASQE
jgi:tetratricopeptide (TPR) repeat protein